jgi:hypothetical protein
MLGANLLVAATDDEETAARLGAVCGREGAAVGANWAFAPSSTSTTISATPSRTPGPSAPIPTG